MLLSRTICECPTRRIKPEVVSVQGNMPRVQAATSIDSSTSIHSINVRINVIGITVIRGNSIIAQFKTFETRVRT